MHYYSWSFVYVAFYVVTSLISSIVRIISFMPMFRVLWSQLAMHYKNLIKIVLATCHLKNYFCYHLPTRGRVGVKLGDAWYVANISIIFDAPCLFYTSCFMFSLHFVEFYAFSGTNLLRRCHSASSYFLLFFYSRFLPKEIFLELDETKPEVPIFLSRTWSPKGRQRRSGRRPHHRVAWAHLWPRHHMVWAPRASTDIALPPIYCLWCENPKSSGIHPRKVPQCRRHRRAILGDRSLYSGTLLGRGIAPGVISIDCTAISIIVADSHDEEGVVLPRGWGLYR
jgi:hypothetical protein